MSREPSQLRNLVHMRILMCIVPLLMTVSSAAAQVCTHDDVSFYSKGNFKVRDVRIESPLDFMRAMSSRLKELKAQLPLQPGGVFTLEKSGEGRVIIEKALDALEEETDPLSRVRVILAGFDNCDENAAQPVVDVYYRIFTTNYNSYLGHTFEIKSDEIERPASAAALTAARTRTKGYVKLQPFAGYNGSRQFFGGVRAGVRMPGWIFDSAELSIGGSNTWNEQSIEISGSRTTGKDANNYLEYRVKFRHTDLAAGPNRLREGLLLAQVFGGTKPLGSAGIVIRYGASLEGGNQQTDRTLAALADQSIASSGYGGLKAYVGTTLRVKGISATANYALQIGTRGATTDIDFVKHIGDVAINGQWLLNPKPGEFHRFVSLEAQFTGGAIRTLGTLPVTQRFFGGNVTRDFIEGDTWRIRSAPFIRSIPEDRLNAALAIGGTGFYSANLTLGIPLWGKPLVPKEIAKDPTFPELLEGQKESARKQLVFRHLNEVPVFSKLVTDLKPIDGELNQLGAALATLPGECPQEPPDEEEDQRSDLEKTRCTVKDLVVVIRSWLKDEEKEELPSRLDAMLRARDDDPACVDEDTCSTLKRLRVGLENLSGMLRPAGFTQVADVADTVRNSLAARQPSLLDAYNTIDAGPEKKEAERLGTEDMKQLEPVLDSFINELNWFAVSPVAIFDAARIWPDPHGTRFGIGGGVRISVVNFDVTLGYAVNPSPKLNEKRGAIFFSMNITDLFR